MALKPSKRKHKDMIVVAMPAYGTVAIKVYTAIDAAVRYLQERGIPVAMIHGEGTYTHDARNNCVKSAFNSPGMADADGYPRWSHLFFVDSDMLFNPDLIYNLYKHDKDIACGCYVQKKTPFVPNAGTLNPDGITYDFYGPNYFDPKGLIEVDMAGTGLMLINRRVFMKMDWPWFEFLRTPTTEERAKEQITKYHQRTCEVMGEDVAFCRKAKELGFKVWLDLHNQGSHLGSYGYDFRDFAFANKAKIAEADDQSKTLDQEGYQA